ncbi:di-heme oxidoreductase family protein [Vibrio neonatus]|uniref:di-heme oxidoreductase family protein n=1 Tax=Vibrio neonatus TaxID=278860 RepID=UPI0021C287F7|nr:di-heme oxidoredictase family protein [Vibrio neonatus]
MFKSFRRILVVISCFASLFIFTFDAAAYDVRSGGATTVKKEGANAFSLPAANLPISKRLDFSVGNSFFRNPWIPAPATTEARDGLGPLFNTNGCQNCHVKDGRGHPPEENDLHAVSMLIRLSIPAVTDKQKQLLLTQGSIPEPIYGGQLQDFAVTGHPAEGKINIHYQTQAVSFADGTVVNLRKPTVSISNLNYGPMAKDTMLSARVTPPMIGLGLLEAIPESTILAWQDINDEDGDGISGKANQVWSVEQQKTVLGRFGWKAGQPSLMQQNAAAFNGDLGITSRLFPSENCTAKQSICDELPNGNGNSGEFEVSDKILDFVEFYSQHLAVPSRRNLDSLQVQQGEALFAKAGCDSCHKPSVITADVPEFPALSKQRISPYTDLLLHDMGEGLADNRGEFTANGQEWRTPPLWGIGYTQEVNGHTYFLHDGRARNLLEAVLWHGGEAKSAQQYVLNLDKPQREALLAFLNSL